MTQQTAAKTSGKQIVIGTAVAVISICFSIFMLEIGVRFLSPPYNPAVGHFFACHNTLGWTGVPKFKGVLEDANFQQAIQLNSLGMHDTEHPLNKPPGTFRILLLGDSFVQAVQVNEADTAHQILEDNLNAQSDGHQHFEVLSGGVVNWGTNQQLVYYREQGRHFQPDLVLLAFYIGNDFLDNLPGNVITTHGHNCYAPYFAVCDNRLNPAPLTYAPGVSRLQNNCSTLQRALINSTGWLFQHSRLYQQIEPLIVANHPRREFGRNFPSAFSALYLPTGETELEQARQTTEATLSRLKQEVEAGGTRFAVALISPDIIVRLGVLSPEEQAVFLSDNPALAQAQIDQPNQQLAEFLTREEIPFIDLTPPMTEHLAANHIPLYILGEGHWTVEGNRLAGDVLARWLVENSFLDANALGPTLRP